MLRTRRRMIEEHILYYNKMSYEEYATSMFLEQCSKNTGPQGVPCALCPPEDHHFRHKCECLPPSTPQYLTCVKLRSPWRCRYSREYTIEQTNLNKKKKLCKRHTLFAFEELVKLHIRPNWLLKNLRFISKTHMEVAIDERARRRTCGYVLCSERLTTVHPQLAHDEEDSGQRQFCSLFCRKAANFLLKQMFKTIWWRDDGDIPVFKILPRITKFTETCDFKNCASRCNLP